MKFNRKIALGSLLLLSTTSAFAVDTADLTVIGTIAPAACTPSFAAGGVVDYGKIATASLSPSVATKLVEKTIAYTLACRAPISVGISFVDGRPGTEIPTAEQAELSFGLGKQGTASIGAYWIQPVQAGITGDGNPVDMIQSDSGAPWVKPGLGLASDSGIRVHSYAPTGTLVPGTYSDISGTLAVTATIAPTSLLDLTQSIDLDGLATMTVRYL